VHSIEEPTTFVPKILTTEGCPFERGEDGIPEVMVTVATIAERVEQLLSLMREADLSTLLALDRELHLLLEQKGGRSCGCGKVRQSKRSFASNIPIWQLILIFLPWSGSIPNIPWRKTKP
jgi:hypothetical protein